MEQEEIENNSNIVQFNDQINSEQLLLPNIESPDRDNILRINPIRNSNEIESSILVDYFENDFLYLSNRSHNQNPFRNPRRFPNYSRIFNPFVWRYDINENINTYSRSLLDGVDLQSDNEDLNNRNNILKASIELYGTLVIYTIKKLSTSKLIIFTLITEKIYKKILDIYLNNIAFEKSDSKSLFKLTKHFMNCIPSLKFIEQFINKINFKSKKHERNIFFIKICIDIYEDYFKTFDYPLFKKYSSQFLNLAIKFYNKLNEDNLKFIKDQISSHFKNSKIKSFEFNTIKEYVDYYVNEKLEYICFSGGLNENMLFTY